MTSLNIEEISRRLSHTLDCLGYSPQMVQIRKNFYNIQDAYFNAERTVNEIAMKTVGSRAEGMTRFYESDWDILRLKRHVCITEDHISTENIPVSLPAFHMVPCLSHPGHFKLLLKRHCIGYDESDLNQSENGCWLSSKKVFAATKHEASTASGPAQTLIDKSNVAYDMVLSFPCACPRIIQRWIQRQRRYDWPPIDLREYILHMPANFVATGQKGCLEEEIEWRLCFNEIELLLIDSWNDTQRKLYKVLKMIKKDVFVSADFKISSFMMKNIVLWLSEAYPQSDFKPESLMTWIIKSLRLLRKAVKVYNLPYYMIPERNLMSERIPRSQCKSLTREISDLIHCGPQLLWECKKLEFAMSMTPNELLYYMDRCDILEVIVMDFALRHVYFGRDIVSYSYGIQISNILRYSQWPHAVTEMVQENTDIFKLLLG